MRTVRILKVKWNQINWEQAEAYINRLQIRIVKATLEEKWRLVKRLQYLITNSFYGRAMAVKRVISNKGKNTPGIDGAVWKTDKEKEDAIRNLQTKGFTASPLRRIYIEKFGKKEKRPLGIPTMFDRAMQALQLLGLEPVAETKADTVSFGFRKYRGAFDAKEYAFSILCRKDSPQWILEGDIKGCFDNISHEWLTKNVTMDKRVLRQFIKSGFVFENKLYPTKEGTPQGGIISPTLANVTLDGMEKLIKDIYWANAKGTVSVKNNKYKVHLIKYADDFVVTASNKETLEAIKEMIKIFLLERGLMLSEEKTKITHIKEGFDFLGWNFRKYNDKLIIKPSEKSIRKVKQTISKIIKTNKTSTQEKVIYLLNQVTRGWAEYHHTVCAKETFSKIDHCIWEMLWKWSKRRHPNKSKNWIVRKYWKNHKGRSWSFMSDKNILFYMNDMPILRNTQLRLNTNPFLDSDYFIKREKERRYKRQKAIKSNKAALIGYYAL